MILVLTEARTAEARSQCACHGSSVVGRWRVQQADLQGETHGSLTDWIYENVTGFKMLHEVGYSSRLLCPLCLCSRRPEAALQTVSMIMNFFFVSPE